MASSLWSTGPAHIGVGFGAGFGGVAGSLSYLGTAERAPAMAIHPAFVDLQNDLGGHAGVPIDAAYSGSYGTISMMLTRWDQSVLNSVMAADDGSGATKGKDANTDIGTLVLQENYAMTVSVQFPFQAISAYSGMEPGYRWWACLLENVDFNTIGTEGRKVFLSFRALRVFTVSDGSFTLFDNPSSGYPSIT